MSERTPSRRPSAPPGVAPHLHELDARLAALGPPANPMAVSQVDAFTVATLISPAVPDPEEWLPVVWGGAPGDEWSAEDAETIAALINQHSASLDKALSEGRFEPILDPGDDGHPDWRLWAVGFGVALALYPEGWDRFEDEGARIAYQDLRDLSRRALGLGGFAEDRVAEIEQHAEAIIRDGVQVLYDEVVTMQAEEILAFSALHPQGVLPEAPVRLGPKVGRNDPCPCGSGKKHKKCCGA